MGEDDDSFRVNAWNWGVLHHIVACAHLFPEEFWEPKRSSFGGALESEQVAALADFLEKELSPRLRPGQRMFFDGSVTDEPDDGTFYRDEDEMWRNYSLHHSVLEEAIEFLRQVRAPVEVM